MSTPITACLVIKACKNEKDYQEFLRRIRINIKFGAMTTYDCEHKPPCEPPTPEEQAAFEKRFDVDLKRIQAEVKALRSKR